MDLIEFVNNYCLGKDYDSCKDSPCGWSSKSDGCTHPKHPKMITENEPPNQPDRTEEQPKNNINRRALIEEIATRKTY